MKRLLIYICIIAYALPLSARVRKLPADSIILITQMTDPNAVLPELTGLISYKSGHIWLHDLVDCMAHIPIKKGTTLTLNIVEEPIEARWRKIRLTGFPNGTRLKIHIPLPPQKELYVNGHPALYRKEGRYVVIDRKWNQGYEILIQ